MFAGDDPACHSARMPKHPRTSRMSRDHVNGDPRSKQPRALEDGNWVCEDPDCGNVNYPRRTECNKCGRRRGQLGDAVVQAYMESMKIVRRDVHTSTVPSSMVGGAERMGFARGMMPDNGADISQQGMVSSHLGFMSEIDPWMGRGYDQPLPYNSQYVAEGGGLSARNSTLSVAKEGKRIAEQLVATFAASHDPLGDAGEVLASAALWLQTMKSRMQNAGDGSPSLQMNGGPSAPLMPFGDYSRGSYLPRVSPNGHLGTRTHPNLRYEDYKDRPSDFLREFGDPAAVSASSMGSGLKPEPGVHGNWECEECKNVNFPRRTNCFQCHKKRGLRGDDIVRKYVRTLIEEAGGII